MYEKREKMFVEVYRRCEEISQNMCMAMVTTVYVVFSYCSS